MKHSFIVFLGVDGSGKSTLISELKNKYSKNYSFHFCPTKRYNKSDVINNDPHGQVSYSLFISIIKLLFLVGQFNWGYLFNLKYNYSNHLIIGDRYFYDLYIDPKRYKLNNVPRPVIKLLFYLIPSPDFVFLCIGEPEQLRKRKPEISISEIVKQQNSLKKLSANRKNWFVLNTTEQTVENLTSLIDKIICK